MWGEVTPAERLRAVTRRNVDDDRLAAEAAGALAGFASEPASLVVACRHVLDASPHPRTACGGCARAILAAAEPGGGRAHRRIGTREGTAPATGSAPRCRSWRRGEVIAAIGWPAAFDDALHRAVRSGYRRGARRRRGSRHRCCAGAAAITRCESSTRGTQHSSESPRLLVPRGRDRPRRARSFRSGRPTRSPGSRRTKCGSSAAWVGCCRAACTRCCCASREADDDFEEISLERFDRLAGPRRHRASDRRRRAHRLPGRPGTAAATELSR